MFDHIDTVALGMFFGFVGIVITIVIATIFGIKDGIVHRINMQYSLNLAAKMNDKMMNDILAEANEDYTRSVDQTLDMVNQN